MDRYKLLTPRVIVTAVLTGGIPLIITGFLVFRDARADEAFFTDAFYSLGFFIVLFSAFHLFVLNKEVNRFHEQAKRGDRAPPSHRLQIVMGVAAGMMAYLALAFVLIAYSFFTL